MNLWSALINKETEEAVLSILRDLVITLIVLAGVFVIYLSLQGLRQIGLPQEWILRVESVDEDLAFATIGLTGFRLLQKLWLGW